MYTCRRYTAMATAMAWQQRFAEKACVYTYVYTCTYILYMYPYTHSFGYFHVHVHMQTVYCNRAAAKMRKKDFKLALEDCDEALKLNADYVKAISRRAECLMQVLRVCVWCVRVCVYVCVCERESVCVCEREAQRP